MHRLEKLVCIHYAYEIRKTEHGEGAGDWGVRAAHLLVKSRASAFGYSSPGRSRKSQEFSVGREGDRGRARRLSEVRRAALKGPTEDKLRDEGTGQCPDGGGIGGKTISKGLSWGGLCGMHMVGNVWGAKLLCSQCVDHSLKELPWNARVRDTIEGFIQTSAGPLNHIMGEYCKERYSPMQTEYFHFN